MDEKTIDDGGPAFPREEGAAVSDNDTSAASDVWTQAEPGDGSDWYWIKASGQVPLVQFIFRNTQGYWTNCPGAERGYKHWTELVEAGWWRSVHPIESAESLHALREKAARCEELEREVSRLEARVRDLAAFVRDFMLAHRSANYTCACFQGVRCLACRARALLAPEQRNAENANSEENV